MVLNKATQSNSRQADAVPVSPERRDVRFEYTPAFLRILKHWNASLLASTYQVGKLAAVGVAGEQRTFSFHNFEQAMGVVVSPQRPLVGTRGHAWK